MGEGVNSMPPCTSIVQSYQYSPQYTQKRKMVRTPYTQKRKLKKIIIRSDLSKDTINQPESQQFSQVAYPSNTAVFAPHRQGSFAGGTKATSCTLPRETADIQATVFIQLNAAAFIKFLAFLMRRLFKGGKRVYARAGRLFRNHFS